MSVLDRFYWLAVGITTYVGIASMQHDGVTTMRAVVLLGLPLLLAWIWQKSSTRTIQEAGAAPTCLRLSSAAAGVWLTARLGAPQIAALEMAATLATGTSAGAAVYALSRIPWRPGLLHPAERAQQGVSLWPRRSHPSESIDATLFMGVMWTVAFVVATLQFVTPGTLQLDPLTLDYAATAASIGGLLVLSASAWRLRATRGLELGTSDRAAGALALSVTCLSVAVPTVAIDLAPPDRVLPGALLLASHTTLWALLVRDARVVAAVLRATLVLMVLGVPAALLTGALAGQQVAHAGLIALVGCSFSLGIGLLTRAAARPLGPDRSRWIRAIEKASQGALLPEPQPAIIATLTALKGTSTSPRATPRLYLMTPARVQYVDVAGYLHEEDGGAPADLYRLGELEPERTLRAEVLDAQQVRKPEVRALLSWFEVRGAFSATIIRDDDGPIGFLLLPRGDRSAPMTLEEAQALRALADRLSALIAVTSALTRYRTREYAARDEAIRWKSEYQHAERALAGQSQRNVATAQILARPLLANAFSPAVRLTLETAHEAVPLNLARILLTRTGIDPIPWAAAIHLAAKNRPGALVVVQCALETARNIEAWNDPLLSPLALASEGTLVLQDLELLPLPAQEIVARHLLAGSPHPEQSRAAQVIVSISHEPSALLECERVCPAIYSALQLPPLVLPSLAERPEDLRSIVVDSLARSPLQPDRSPLGIGRRALQALMDHPWPGNERELADLLARAAQFTEGPQLTYEALLTAGFTPPPKLTTETPALVDAPPTSQPSPTGKEPTSANGHDDPDSPRRRPRARRPRRRS